MKFQNYGHIINKTTWSYTYQFYCL